MLYPLRFTPLYKERIWGGRKIQEFFGKHIPEGRVGESWEISGRPGDVSVIANGPLKGRDLRWLMENHSLELLGREAGIAEPFPLLVKILDAADDLSLQVHPPATVAAELGGEPKTEMWYVVHAEPGAKLYVGLREGVSRGEFERRVREGTVAECFHEIHVRSGDAMFLPSGRVHAIGKGLLIFEIQQNSDTTYRVFDWNRTGPDGKMRQLHVSESLRSIDFADVEPSLCSQPAVGTFYGASRPLVRDTLFDVDAVDILPARRAQVCDKLTVVAVAEGQLTIHGDTCEVSLTPGDFALIPAAARAEIGTAAGAKFIKAQVPGSS